MTKTRGVFALITKGKMLLLSERTDGKGWNLPGGRVEEGETDQVALVREVKEETGLDVEVLHQVGPDHVFNDDTALAYACKVVSGQLTITAEAKNHAWVNAQEVRQGYFYNPEYDEMGNRTFENEQKFDIKLVGPEGRLGRTGRMVWDAFSLMANPKRDRIPFDMPEFFVLGTTGDAIPHDFQVGETRTIGTDFFQRLDEHTFDYWPRLDPYSPTGEMLSSLPWWSVKVVVGCDDSGNDKFRSYYTQAGDKIAAAKIMSQMNGLRSFTEEEANTYVKGPFETLELARKG